MSFEAILEETRKHLDRNDILSALQVTGDADQALAEKDISKIFVAAEIYRTANGYAEAAKLYDYCWRQHPNQASLKTKLIESHTANYNWDLAIEVFFSTPTPPEELNQQAYYVALSILSSGHLDHFADLYEILRDNLMQNLSIYVLQLLHFSGNTSAIIPILEQMGLTVDQSYRAAVITEIIKDYYHDKPTQELLEILQKIFGNAANQSWLYYQLLRDHSVTDLPSIPQEEPSFPIETGAFDYLAQPKSNAYLLQPNANLDAIEINEEVFSKGLLNFRKLVGQMIEEGFLSTQLDNIQHALENAPDHCKKPIFILSSGRSGTTALHHKFQQLPESFSYHSYQWQMNVLEMNHALYRMLTNSLTDQYDLTAFKDTIRTFVKSRCSELIYAINKGQRPVLTGHWDTIFTPIWAEIFPESIFIHMYRDHKDVFRSSYLKNQWYNNQLQPYMYDPSFPEGKFHASRVPEYDITEKISWFLYVTERFAHLFFDTLPDSRCLHVKSENLFTSHQKTYEELIQFLDIPSLTVKGLQDHYANPINEKSDKPIFRQNVDKEIEKMIFYHQDLKEKGRLTIR